MARIVVPAAESASVMATIAGAPPGAEIVLPTGTITLEAPLVIDRPLTLVGAGSEVTRLECAAEGCVAAVTADVVVTIRGMTLAHIGDACADASCASTPDDSSWRRVG